MEIKDGLWGGGGLMIIKRMLMIQNKRLKINKGNNIRNKTYKKWANPVTI